MAKDILASPKTTKKAKFMIQTIMHEALSELRDAPPEMVEASFAQSTALMHWVSTGEIAQGIPMPEGFWDHTGAILPQLLPAAPAAIEAGTAGE